MGHRHSSRSALFCHLAEAINGVKPLFPLPIPGDSLHPDEPVFSLSMRMTMNMHMGYESFWEYKPKKGGNGHSNIIISVASKGVNSSFLSLGAVNPAPVSAKPQPGKIVLGKLPFSCSSPSPDEKQKKKSASASGIIRFSIPKAFHIRKKEKSAKSGFHSPRQQVDRLLRQLLCGGFAGVVSRSAVAPLDLIKTHLMTGDGAARSAVGVFLEIVKRDGWRGLFRGNAINCIRVAPNKAIELCVFESVRRVLNKEGNPVQNFAAMIAGGAAGIAGTIATYPLELIRTRISIQPELYSNLFHAIGRISKEEGIGAFYSGLTPSVIGVFPYAATNYFVYDRLCTAYRRSTRKKTIPVLPTLLFGAIAAAASSAVTFPLDVARKKMQLSVAPGMLVQKSAIGVIQEIYTRQGFLALYRGLGTTWLKLVPAAGISFMCYEAAKIALLIDESSLLLRSQQSPQGDNAEEI